MLKRLISSIVALPILLFVVIMGGNYIKVAAMLLSLVGLHEFYYAFRQAGYQPSEKLAFTYTFILYGLGFVDAGPIFFISL